MLDLQPRHISFGTLVHGRLFRIPQYQRAYSWQRRHRKDLFEDIRRLSQKGDDASHFMATIVGLRREKRTILTDVHEVIEIVDGQQRITTLILLIKAIAMTLDRSDDVEDKIGQELDGMLVKSDEASLLRLQTNHDSSDYFANYLRTGDHPSSGAAYILADRELLRAIEECEQFVSQWQEDYYNGRSKDIHGERIGTDYKEGDFSGVAIDPEDPPRYESQATYLKRLDLLLPGELKRLTSADFEPELVMPEDDETEAADDAA